MESNVKLNGIKNTVTRALTKPALAILFAAVVTGCGSGTISGSYSGSSFNAGTSGGSGFVGGGTVDSGTGDVGGGTGGGSDVVTTQCSTSGLAVTDLSGQCRASPQATMGALEASS